jgi:hypothetical protein
VNNELERMGMKAGVDYFEALFQNIPAGIE